MLLANEESRKLEEDVSRLKAIGVVSILNDMAGGGAMLPEDLISELYHFGAGEIHTVASIIGGIASQEAIKVEVYVAASDSAVHTRIRGFCVSCYECNISSFESVATT